MKYTLTKDLETGNTLIDSEHRELFKAINNLMDACSQGKGRDQIKSMLRFLTDYTSKHFSDEEKLQTDKKYPGYPAHKKFHESYKLKLGQVSNQIETEGPTIVALSKLNEVVGILVNHIRVEDKKMAAYVTSA